MPTIKEKIDEILERHYYERLEAIGINLYELGKWYFKVYVSLPIIDSSIKSFNHSEAFKLFQEFKKNDFIDYFERGYTEDENEVNYSRF